MSELSELYAVMTTESGGKVSYPWRDTNYNAYYQSFTRYPERGYIDQSIFAYSRDNDDLSFGSHITQFFTIHSDGSWSWNNPFFTVVEKNRLRVNQVGVFNGGDYYALSGGQMIRSYQYSPNDLKMSDFSQKFFIDYDPARFCLIPRFDIVLSNFTIVTGLTYNDLLNRSDNYLIKKIILNTQTGVRGLPVFFQFAGKINNSTLLNEYDERGFKENDYQNIVTIFPWNNTILDLPTAIGYTNRVRVFAGNQVCPFNIVPYLQSFINETSSSKEVNYGISLDTAYQILCKLGVYWTKGYTYDGSSLGTHTTSPDIVGALIDPETHMVTNEVHEGVDIANYALNNPDCSYNWGTGAVNYDGKNIIEIRLEYDNQQGVQNLEEADEIDLNVPVIATTGGNTLWIMNETQVKKFFTWLWDPDGKKFDDIVKGCALLGENPMDSIISLRMYPLQLTTYLQYAHHSICFGRTDSELNNFYVTSSNVIVIDLGSFYFNDSGMFNDFRDYEPYSRYSLYVPFCGIIPLSAIECINTDISIKMIIDLVTGACTAVIYTNKVPYKYLDGMIGIEVPVTGRNMSGYAQTVLGAALGGAGGGLAMGNKASGAMASKHSSRATQLMSTDAMNINSAGSLAPTTLGDMAAGEFTAAMNTPSIALGLSTAIAGAAIAGTVAALSNAPAVESKGSNTPAMGIAKPLYPYFIVQRSECWMPENYAKLYGRPLNEGGKIGDFSGYSEFGNINLDGISGATSAEKTLIAELLTSGVYL